MQWPAEHTADTPGGTGALTQSAVQALLPQNTAPALARELTAIQLLPQPQQVVPDRR